MTTCRRSGCEQPAGRHTRGYCVPDYRRALRMGFHGWRDPEPVRARLRALREMGWTWEQIADAAGISTWVAHRIGTGRNRHLLAESEAALMSVPLVPRGSRRGVDSTGTRRRVQALAWMGWPCTEVAKRAGTTRGSLATLILPHRRPSFDLALRVARVYDDLWMTPGPSKITAGKARGAGFAPPLAWDDDTIDDPDAVPNLGETVPRRAALVEDAGELFAQGYPVDVVAARLGTTAGYAHKLRARAAA